MRKKKEVDIVTEFWQKYYDSDLLEREEMIKKLPVIKEMKVLLKSKIPEEHIERTINMILISYFDDLINFMECKNEKRR